jgi:hypothetical protein
MQALLSRECPLLQPGLSMLMRVLYTAGTWSYLCAALTTPVFAAIPVIAVATGVFPLAVTAQFAAAFVPYFVLMHTGSPSCVIASPWHSHNTFNCILVTGSSVLALTYTHPQSYPIGRSSPYALSSFVTLRVLCPLEHWCVS